MSSPAQRAMRDRIAEGLGWTNVGKLTPGWGTPPPGVRAIPPGAAWEQDVMHAPIPRFDFDWSATGPVIQHYGITLSRRRSGWGASVDEPTDFTHRGMPIFARTHGGVYDRPLDAVCDLLLLLAAAGKLEKVKP